MDRLGHFGIGDAHSLRSARKRSTAPARRATACSGCLAAFDLTSAPRRSRASSRSSIVSCFGSIGRTSVPGGGTRGGRASSGNSVDQFHLQALAESGSGLVHGQQRSRGVFRVQQTVQGHPTRIHTSRHFGLGEPRLSHGPVDLPGQQTLDGDGFRFDQLPILFQQVVQGGAGARVMSLCQDKV